MTRKDIRIRRLRSRLRESRWPAAWNPGWPPADWITSIGRRPSHRNPPREALQAAPESIAPRAEGMHPAQPESPDHGPIHMVGLPEPSGPCPSRAMILLSIMNWQIERPGG